MDKILIHLINAISEKYYLDNKNKINASQIDEIADKVFKSYCTTLFLEEAPDDIFKEKTIGEIQKYINRQNFIVPHQGYMIAYENGYKKENWVAPYRDQMVRFKAFKETLDYLPQSVIDNLDKDTDNILKQLPNPNKYKEFDVCGLVVGLVQMGKTTNFSALINKAIDVGYELIFVFTGTIKDLRNQTQKRLEHACIGYQSFQNITPIGIGKFLNENNVIPCTSSDFITPKGKYMDGDVNDQTLNIYSYNQGKTNIFVSTRSTAVVSRLAEWIRKQSFFNPLTKQAEDISVLIISDECDQATINTKEAGSETAATNAELRDFISLFKKKVHIGYTATPFANIFINPKPYDQDVHGQDFYPKDFIYLIEPPNNYLGPSEFFGPDAYPFVVNVNDRENLYTESGLLEDLTDSLKDAIINYIFNGAIRSLRGHGNKHHSMIVNIDIKKEYQQILYELISNYIDGLRKVFGTSSEKELILNVKQLLDTFTSRSLIIEQKDKEKQVIGQDESYNCEFTLDEITKAFKDYLFAKDKSGDYKIKLVCLNSASPDKLHYNQYEKNGGLHVIAVGGYKLSRGFTFEGLTVSYYLRDSAQADTQLQSCRWFGYADDYRDLIRLYASEGVIQFLTASTNIIQNLINLIKTMAEQEKTPQEFKFYIERMRERVCFSKNKKIVKKELKPCSPIRMSSATVVDIDPDSQHVVPAWKLDFDISDFDLDKKIASSNIEAVKSFAKELGKPLERKGYYYFPEVEFEKLFSLIESLTICSKSRAQSSDDIDYAIKKCAKRNLLKTIDVVFISIDSRDGDSIPSNYKLNKYMTVGLSQRRTCELNEKTNTIKVTGGRALTSRHLAYGLKEEEIERIEALTGRKFSDRKTPETHFVAEERAKRQSGVLMIYLYSPTAINEVLNEKYPTKMKQFKGFTEPLVGIYLALPGDRHSEKKSIYASVGLLETILEEMKHERDDLI